MFLLCTEHGLVSCTLQGWGAHKKTELNWKLEPQGHSCVQPKIALVTCDWWGEHCTSDYCGTSVWHVYMQNKWQVKVQKIPITWEQYLQLDLRCPAGLGHPVHPASLVVQVSLVALPCQAVPDFPQAHGNQGLQDYQPDTEREEFQWTAVLVIDSFWHFKMVTGAIHKCKEMSAEMQFLNSCLFGFFFFLNKQLKSIVAWFLRGLYSSLTGEKWKTNLFCQKR